MKKKISIQPLNLLTLEPNNLIVLKAKSGVAMPISNYLIPQN